MDNDATSHDVAPGDVHRLLGNDRRRRAVRLLDDLGFVEIATLASHLAADELDLKVSEVSADRRRSAHMSLYQSHVPQLVDAGVVLYDEETNRVGPGPRLGQFANVLDAVEQTFGNQSSSTEVAP